MAPGDQHILVVDDDPRLRSLLQRYLTDQGFSVTVAADAGEARERMQGIAFDALVLDVMMPGESGLSLTESLRTGSGTADVPILLLSAMGQTSDRIDGLDKGADDYLSKPFEPQELVLRLRSILRRRGNVTPVTATNRLSFGGFIYDPAQQRLTQDGVLQRLTAVELRFLAILATQANRPVPRADFADGIDPADRSIDVSIMRLRRKIEADPKQPAHLMTIRGTGYQLNADVI